MDLNDIDPSKDPPVIQRAKTRIRELEAEDKNFHKRNELWEETFGGPLYSDEQIKNHNAKNDADIKAQCKLIGDFKYDYAMKGSVGKP